MSYFPPNPFWLFQKDSFTCSKSQRLTSQSIISATIRTLPSVPSNRASTTATLTFSGFPQTKRELSNLERIPVELLHRIFEYCPTLSLPMSSPYIGSALASDHLRQGLVIDAFSYETDEIDFTAAQIEFQSALLRQKWLSFAFFQDCQKRYMLIQAVCLYRKHFSDLPANEQTTTIASLITYFNNYFTPGARMYRNIEAWHRCRVLPTLDNGHSEFKLTNSNETRLTIILWKEGTQMEFFVNEERSPVKIYFPRYLTCKIPERLLHGPWTNDRGNLLSLLLVYVLRIDWSSSTNKEIARKGLEDAIRENNILAVRTLVEHHCRYGRESIKRQFEDYFGLEAKEFDERQVTELLEPQGQWIFSPYAQESVRAGVFIRTEHLRIAVLEMGCDVAMLNALTVTGPVHHIDGDDRDLLNWATEQSQPFKNDALNRKVKSGDSGTMLLHFLTHVRQSNLWWNRPRGL
jgi:hypothetical protein